VLVTGASGFAGGHLVRLLAASHEVVGWTRGRPPDDLAALARWQQVDLLDRDGVTAAIRELKPSRVFHCAGLPQVAESWADTAAPLEVNVLGTHRLLDALRRAGLPCRVLVTGSAHVYAPSTAPLTEDDPIGPSSPYALSKLAQEQLARAAGSEDGLEIVVTRSFNHTGPAQQPSFVAPSIARQIAAIEQGRQQPVIRVGNTDATRDLLDVRDTVRAYAALMERGEAGGVYNVSSGVGRRVHEVLDALISRAHVPVRVDPDPSRMRASDIPILIGDPTRLKRATGWEPEIPFAQTIDDLLAYWRLTGV
jgi:GDP-4-dehydro-6-deoxy-D-mannose reductase